jgi:hypothetical protein
MLPASSGGSGFLAPCQEAVSAAGEFADYRWRQIRRRTVAGLGGGGIHNWRRQRLRLRSLLLLVAAPAAAAVSSPQATRRT